MSPAVQTSNSQKTAQIPATLSDKMYIAYSSATGEFIGLGKDKVFTANDGDFTTKVINGIVSIDFKGKTTFGESWNLEFAAPGNGKLTLGKYDKAERCAFHDKTRPGLEFTGSGRGCNKIAGNFNIENILYSGDELKILYLDATFVQYCDEKAFPLFGRVHYDVRP